MASISLRELCNCIGFTGKISIVKNFFGYRNNILQDLSNIPLKHPISLLRQVKLLKYDPHIRIHIKFIDPWWGLQDPAAPTDLLIEAMRLLYGDVGIGVVIKSTEYVTVAEDFLDIDIEDCSHGSPSDEVEALYNGNINYVAFEYDPDLGFYFTREIVLFLVRYLGGIGSAADGCAASYTAAPCAVIAWGNKEPRYIMAHEVGHLLGLEHPDDEEEDPPVCFPNRLMTDCGISKTPFLTVSEVEDMKKSHLMFNC